MHQTEIRKAVDRPLLGIPGGGFIWFRWLWVRGKLISPARSLSQASYWKEGMWWWWCWEGIAGGVWGVWIWVGEGGCQRCPTSLLIPLSLWVCPNTPSLALRLADSASFLSVLKREKSHTSTWTVFVTPRKTATLTRWARVGQCVFSKSK